MDDRQQQEGLQVSAQVGTFRQGDGHTQDYQASYGIQGPTTSIVFGGSYVNQDEVRKEKGVPLKTLGVIHVNDNWGSSLAKAAEGRIDVGNVHGFIV